MLDVDCLVVQARRAGLRDVVEQVCWITMSGVAGAQELNGVKGRFRVRDSVLIRAAGRAGSKAATPGTQRPDGDLRQTQRRVNPTLAEKSN